MSSRTLRLSKEERPLFWPWIAVITLGGASSVDFRWGTLHIGDLMGLATLIGIPLLATLPFGLEFQHRTLAILLSQPVDRSKIWADKIKTAFFAAASTSAVYYLYWRAAAQGHPKLLQLIWPLLIVVTVCSATYWTLVGKSTLNGLMLNLMVGGILTAIVLYGDALGLPIVLGKAAAPAVVFLALSFAAVMLWLGRRRFVQFEATGTGEGADFTAGVLGGAFRPRPGSLFRNMVGKEIRLLAPLWLLSFVTVLLLICLMPLERMLPETGMSATIVSYLSAAIAGITIALAPLLAGALSVGEERTIGTQTWNLVLPMPVRRQWILKLVVGLFTCFAAQALVFLAISVNSRDALSPLLFGQNDWHPSELIALSAMTFVAAFWSACVTNGTVRASLLAFPVVVLAGGTATLGFWLGANQETSSLVQFLLARFHPFPFSGKTLRTVWQVLPFVMSGVVSVAALWQGYRLFRRDAPDPHWTLIARRLLPLLMVALLAGMSLSVVQILSFTPNFQFRQVMKEVHGGAYKLYRDAGKLDPIRVSPENLALSSTTRDWLRNTTVTIVPIGNAPSAVALYYVSISYANGRECRTAGYYWWCLENGNPMKEIPSNGPLVPAIFVPANIAEAMLISKIPPVLPANVDEKKPSTVKLSIFIDKSGVVKSARRVSGEEPFVAAAKKAVEQWRYQPMFVLGWPTNAATTVTIDFP